MKHYSPTVVELFTRDYWGCLRGAETSGLTRVLLTEGESLT